MGSMNKLNSASVEKINVNKFIMDIGLWITDN